MSKSSKPVPIALPNEMVEQIREVCSITGMSQQEVMRLAIRVGLADLKGCNYDIAGAIVTAARASKAHQDVTPTNVHQLSATAAPAAEQPTSSTSGHKRTKNV